MVLSRTKSQEEEEENVEQIFGARYTREPVPKNRFPERGLPKDASYQIVADQLQLDGKPRLNLASFVTTWMEPEAEKLMMESFNKNAIDVVEYPAIHEIQGICVNMVARLFNAPLQAGQQAVGTSTVGSSEGILLAGLAMKRRWVHDRASKNLPIDNPNLVVGANLHVVIEKFANYFDVELRMVPISRRCLTMNPDQAIQLCDENTIGVISIMGSTQTGHFEDVKTLDSCIQKLNKEKGWNIRIHVDAASGGFVAPFIYPELEWDFRLPMVCSINASGHKYGLTYPGIGWVIWRSEEYLPEDLIFHVDYLGEDQPTFTLNFSRGSNQIIGQYYQFIRLGFEGYRSVMLNCLSVTNFLKVKLSETGMFDIYSDAPQGIPLVAFALRRNIPDENRITENILVDALRAYGWIVPAFNLSPNLEEITLMRVCVREDLSRGLAEWLIRDLMKSIKRLEEHGLKAPIPFKPSMGIVSQAQEKENQIGPGIVKKMASKVGRDMKYQFVKKKNVVC